MATQLKNIVRFVNVAAGATVALPHGLAWSPPAGGELPQIPDVCLPDRGGFLVTADATNVTVTNTTAAVRSLDVLVEKWHTMERDFGNAAVENLTPRPFVLNLGDTGMPDDSAVLGFGKSSLPGTADAAAELAPWWELSDESEPTGVALVAPRNGTLRNLFVRHNAAGTEGGETTYTVLVNDVPTLLAVTLSTDAIGQGSDLVDAVPVAQGDRIRMTALNGEEGGGGAVAVTATMLFED